MHLLAVKVGEEGHVVLRPIFFKLNCTCCEVSHLGENVLKAVHGTVDFAVVGLSSCMLSVFFDFVVEGIAQLLQDGFLARGHRTEVPVFGVVGVLVVTWSILVTATGLRVATASRRDFLIIYTSLVLVLSHFDHL